MIDVSIGRLCVWTFVMSTCLAQMAVAQQKPVAVGQSVVDIVTLKSGRTLRGAIVFQEPNGSAMIAVSRDWLRQANPMLLASALTENSDLRKTAWTQLHDRITDRLKTSGDAPQLTFFLQQELERVNQLLAEPIPAEPEFLWFDVGQEAIAKVVRTTPEHQRLALFAWNERIPQVETRDAAALTKELADKGVKPDGSPPDLADRLAARPQEATEWAARMALMEYTLIKPLEFQGMGDTIARTGEGKTANLTEFLPKLLRQQLGSALKDLSNEGRKPTKTRGDVAWLKSAIRQAEQAKSSGFRVTRLEFDSATSQVTVEMRFIARLTESKWQTIWRTSETADGTKARPEAEARIEQDPQVKSGIDKLKSFGLADPRLIQLAIRVGAATLTAQQTADGSFSDFRDRYVRHLDGPPLSMTPIP